MDRRNGDWLEKRTKMFFPSPFTRWKFNVPIMQNELYRQSLNPNSQGWHGPGLAGKAKQTLFMSQLKPGMGCTLDGAALDNKAANRDRKSGKRRYSATGH